MQLVFSDTQTHFLCSFFLHVIRPLSRSTLFPYTTLFRSLEETLIQHPVIVVDLGEVLVAAVAHEGHDALRYCRERSEEHTSELQSHVKLVCRLLLEKKNMSTSYAVFCLKKKSKQHCKSFT